MKLISLVELLGFILIVEFAGLIGSIFTASAIPTWYATLTKPAFTPPNFLFAPVWTILYLLMGISVYLVWQRGFEKKEVKVALVIFALQLILNIFWSFLFFGLHSPLLALVEIIILWFLILLAIFKFYQISTPAGLLLVPYIIWVSFATILNFYIVRLN